MNKLAKIQHKIIELVVSSSAVPKAKAFEVFHLIPSSSSVIPAWLDFILLGGEGT